MLKKLTTGQKARNETINKIIYNLYTLIGWLKGLQVKKTLNIKY